MQAIAGIGSMSKSRVRSCQQDRAGSPHSSGPARCLGSFFQPMYGQPSGSVENGGSVYRPSQLSSSQSRSQRPNVLQ
jgi:hypothetical protein